MAGFIGGAWSLEGVVKMAELSLAVHDEETKTKKQKTSQM